MASFVLRRLGQLLITLVGISIISWVVITQAPGSPIALTMDPKVSPKVIEQMMKNYDLDKPVYQQYFLWLKKLFTGKLYSFKDGRPVLEKMQYLSASFRQGGNTAFLTILVHLELIWEFRLQPSGWPIF
jgi:peptide/nickel transport system permease protein